MYDPLGPAIRGNTRQISGSAGRSWSPPETEFGSAWSSPEIEFESESLPNSVSGAGHDRSAELDIDTRKENKKGGSCHACFRELSGVCIFRNSWRREVGTGIGMDDGSRRCSDHTVASDVDGFTIHEEVFVR